jgi:hypothetical protein
LGMADQVGTMEDAVTFARARHVVNGSAAARLADADYRYATLALAKARQRTSTGERERLELERRIATRQQAQAVTGT